MTTVQLKGIYKDIPVDKSTGQTYTPYILADFIANQMVETSNFCDKKNLKIFDPAVGNGQLLDSLIERLLKVHQTTDQNIFVYGYDTDKNALDIAKNKLYKKYSNIIIDLKCLDFLSYIIEYNKITDDKNSLYKEPIFKYDFIIANPPYVRTQILGVEKSRTLAKEFNLTGRVDLYHAFILAISQVLNPRGTVGIIVSNRFMTTKSGIMTRKAILNKFNLCKVWDFGDTRLFNKAVLPAVLIMKGINTKSHLRPSFTKIYESDQHPSYISTNVIEALNFKGVIKLLDNRKFEVQHGYLQYDNADEIWTISTRSSAQWLEKVKSHTYCLFGDIGKIRVGVKTTADKVFIKNNWFEDTDGLVPELLKPLITHHVARQFKAKVIDNSHQILYPYEIFQGKRRVIDISLYPNSKKYLEKHKEILETREYLLKAEKKWYELWVPQNPNAWEKTKLVFRDISEKPTFWIDETGGIVNGDCYWLTIDKEKINLLWLALAVANSSFIESFYDYSFCNKLYMGRRRFITQYVEKFPLPYVDKPESKELVNLAKLIYKKLDKEEVANLKTKLDNLVWEAFGLIKKNL